MPKPYTGLFGTSGVIKVFFSASAKKKIVLHIGLPKTGSTALQQAIYERREDLLRQGVLYPANIHRADDPKHNFLLELARKDQGYDLALEPGYKKAQRIVLSNEALSNDLYLHGMERNLKFAEKLKIHGELEVCMVLRRKSDWLRSYYKQAVINQPVKGKPHYQNTLTIQAFQEIEAVRQLLDYESLIQDVCAGFNAPVRVMRYEDATVSQVVEYCTGVPAKTALVRRKHNESVPDAVVEIMRQLNAMIGSLDEKYAWSYVVMQACEIRHDVLNTLASRATEHAVLALDSAKLEALAYRACETPELDKAVVENMITLMKSKLAEINLGKGFNCDG